MCVSSGENNSKPEREQLLMEKMIAVILAKLSINNN